jgi:transposase
MSPQVGIIGIEAGMATHYVARKLLALGHEVKQVPAAYAKPFRQGHKNDFRDAHAIAEAVQRPSTRCVPVKTDDQLDLQALHRVRSRLISDRTAVINQIRSFLLERGIPVRQASARQSSRTWPVPTRSRSLSLARRPQGERTKGTSDRQPLPTFCLEPISKLPTAVDPI